ncbi:HepT-like ribonuclease domain-containing protein [Paraburkholderia bannensis]|uniref:HepT-like ribonuclease domain-containing protein n=1 Tax=Paraburkholderia bannensis TaxID=765414 RepID=UPI002AB6CD6B|nr:DUF86 domain-containing protein [Paraburkholderia bannensis]
MKGELRTPHFVEHMLTAVGRIREYTAPLSLDTFKATPMAIDAVARNFEILGEAARNIMRMDPEFTVRHAAIPWQDIYGMRNQLSHAYFAIDLDLVWQTIQHDLPELQRALLRLKS